MKPMLPPPPPPKMIRKAESDVRCTIASNDIRNAFFGLGNSRDIFNSHFVNLLPYTPKLRKLALIESIEVSQSQNLFFQVRLYQDAKGCAFVSITSPQVNLEYYYMAINKNSHVNLTIDDAHKLWDDLVKHLSNQDFTINYKDKSSRNSIILTAPETIGGREDHEVIR